jgi:transposase
MLSPTAGGDETVIELGEVVMILDLHRQGLSVSAIADHLGIDRKTVRKYLARGLAAPVYGPRQPRPRRIDPFIPYLREQTAVGGDPRPVEFELDPAIESGSQR